MSLSPEQTIKDRYRVIKEIARGGFGAVYLAWDNRLDGLVALKENLESYPGAQEQFELEAKLLFKLRHPNLPRVTDYFVIQNQGQYLVMDYIEGEDLGSMLNSQGSSLPLQDVLNWTRQVCDALGYLHSRKPPIIHRDIKPANIRITNEGAAMLVDFGISKEYDPGKRTVAAAQAITRGYSPPEQYGISATDVRSDIYSLGATIYHLLSGQVPQTAMEAISGSPDSARTLKEINPDIPHEVSAAVAKAMQFEKEARFKTTVEFKEALFAREAYTKASIVSRQRSMGRAKSAPKLVAPTLVVTPQAMDLAARWKTAPSEPPLVLEGHTGSVESVAISPDGYYLASGSVDKTIRLWRMIDGDRLKTLGGHTRSVNCVAFSPDGELLASGSSGKTVRIWRVHDRKALHTIETQTGVVSDLAFLPDRKTLACVVGNQVIQFWRIRDEDQAPVKIRRLATGSPGVTGFTFSPDGAILACESWRDKAVHLWSLGSGELIRKLVGHNADITSVAFSPDGSLLASASWDKTIKLWRAADGSLLNTLDGHKGGVLSLDFSPDGNLLVSGSADYTLRLWEVKNGGSIRRLKGHRDWVNSVVFAPDGDRLASGSRDGTARIWIS